MNERDKKLQELLKDKSFAKEFFNLKTPEDASNLLASHGIACTPEEMRVFGKNVSDAIKKSSCNSGELTEGDLSQVAGGLGTYAQDIRGIDPGACITVPLESLPFYGLTGYDFPTVW